jgi:trk system potassium uptake protein TrkA
MRQVAVIGLGQFGTHLATTLARMGCDVLAIDMQEKPIAAIRDEVQQTVILDVRSLESLKSVITDETDEAIVSLGESLEASILCTLHLKEIGIKRIHAKASSRDHAAILKAVGATHVIFPEQETAERMAHKIVNPDLLDYLPLSKEYRVVEIGVPKAFVGKTPAQLHLRKQYRVLIMAIKKGEGAEPEFMPQAETTLQAGNTLVLMGKEADIASFRKAGED